MSRIALSLCLGLAACSAAPEPRRTTDPAAGPPPFGGGDESGSFGDAEAPSGASEQPAEVWGHSAMQLYRLDPNTKAVTVVGSFSGCQGVVDIALDGESRLFATTDDALFRVDKATAVCTKIAPGSYPNSLSFVPKGTVDPEREALVGYEGGDYVRIDPENGQKRVIGQIGGGLESSGDIVSVKDGATYLTVTGGACSQADCLVEVDPATGALVKNWGSTGRSEVFGLAFWAGRVYGFDAAGGLFEISFEGGKLATRALSIPGGSGALSFWGAGSTTNAPLGGPR